MFRRVRVRVAATGAGRQAAPQLQVAVPVASQVASALVMSASLAPAVFGGGLLTAGAPVGLALLAVSAGLLWLSVGVRAGRRVDTVLTLVVLGTGTAGSVVAVVLDSRGLARPGLVVSLVGLVAVAACLLSPAHRRYVQARRPAGAVDATA